MVCLAIISYYIFLLVLSNNLIFIQVRWPVGVNFSDPEGQGLTGARNFYLETEPDVTVGVWY